MALCFSLLFLLLLSRSSSAFEPLNHEVVALMGIKQALIDPNGVLKNWDEDSADPCSWTMITCSSENRVIVLGAPSQNLSGSLSGAIGNLTDLQQVLLQNNNISGEIPPEIGNLKKLQTLDLSTNGLSGAVPETLGQLQSLHYLRLNNNSLSGSFPAFLTKISQLSFLDISFNNLSGPVPPFPARTFNILGNPLICGSGAMEECSKTVIPLPPSPVGDSSQRKTKTQKIAIAVGTSFSSVSLFVLLLGLLFWRRSQRHQTILGISGTLFSFFFLRLGQPKTLKLVGRCREGRGGGYGDRSGKSASIRTEGTPNRDGEFQLQEHPREGGIRERVQGKTRRRNCGSGEAAQGRLLFRRGPVPYGNGDDQSRRPPKSPPPPRLLLRSERAPPRLPLHAERKRRLPSPRQAGAGLEHEEEDRSGSGERASLPARAVRSEDHPQGREGGEHPARRGLRSRGRRFRPRQAPRPWRFSRDHSRAGNRRPHRAGISLHRPVLGEDGRLRLRDSPPRARLRPQRPRFRRQGRRRHHARLGKHPHPHHPHHLLDDRDLQVRKAHQGRELDLLVDRNLRSGYDKVEVGEMVQVALICTVYSPASRPKMAEVVRMLEGEGLAEKWSAANKIAAGAPPRKSTAAPPPPPDFLLIDGGDGDGDDDGRRSLDAAEMELSGPR